MPWDRITIIRWRPHTCGYEIEQWFDDVASPRVFHYASTLTTCPEHIATGQVLFDTIKNENDRKNTLLDIVENLVSKGVREDATTCAFTANRLAGSDERDSKSQS